MICPFCSPCSPCCPYGDGAKLPRWNSPGMDRRRRRPVRLGGGDAAYVRSMRRGVHRIDPGHLPPESPSQARCHRLFRRRLADRADADSLFHGHRPGQFWFGNFQYPALNTAYRKQEGFERSMTALGKLAYLFKDLLIRPGNLLLAVAAGASLIAFRNQPGQPPHPRRFEMFSLAALVGTLLIGSLAPTPLWWPYFFARSHSWRCSDSALPPTREKPRAGEGLVDRARGLHRHHGGLRNPQTRHGNRLDPSPGPVGAHAIARTRPRHRRPLRQRPDPHPLAAHSPRRRLQNL